MIAKNTTLKGLMSIGVTEVRALWLVEDCVISRCGQLAPRALNIRMAASRFVSVTEEVMNAKKKEIQLEEYQRCSNNFGINWKKDMKFLLLELNEPI